MIIFDHKILQPWLNTLLVGANIANVLLISGIFSVYFQKCLLQCLLT